jgi:SHS family lactate transporter-like MFS transporter
MGRVYLYVIVMAFVGPEYRNRLFDVAHDHDMEDATHEDHGAIEHIVQRADSDLEKGQQRNKDAVHA